MLQWIQSITPSPNWVDFYISVWCLWKPASSRQSLTQSQWCSASGWLCGYPQSLILFSHKDINPLDVNYTNFGLLQIALHPIKMSAFQISHTLSTETFCNLQNVKKKEWFETAASLWPHFCNCWTALAWPVCCYAVCTPWVDWCTERLTQLERRQ